jgi:lysozyme family protein
MYKQKYWDKIHGDDLPSGVDLAVFDCCVNSGPGRASKMLQKVLGVAQDGAIGAQTLLKATTVDSSKLVADYNAERLAFLQALPTVFQIRDNHPHIMPLPPPPLTPTALRHVQLTRFMAVGSLLNRF